MKILYLTKGTVHPDKDCQKILYDYLCQFYNTKIERKSLNNALLMNLNAYDIIVLYFHVKKDASIIVSKLSNYVENGGKLVGIHAIAASYKTNEKWFNLVGGRFLSHPPVGNMKVKYNNKEYLVHDELYIFETKKIDSVMTSYNNDLQQPCGWTKKLGKGCMYYLALGHDKRSVNSIEFQYLLNELLKFTEIND